MGNESDGLTTLAKLVFLVPAVFAMVAAPFWIWARLRPPVEDPDEEEALGEEGELGEDRDLEPPSDT